MCLLLLGEGGLLWKWSRPVQLPPVAAGGTLGSSMVQSIPDYQNLLTFLLIESQRPPPSLAIINLARALPDNITIKRITVDIEPAAAAEIRGIITAQGPEHFREIITTFLKNLNQFFKGSESLGIQDYDFDTNNCVHSGGEQTCTITLRFNLP